MSASLVGSEMCIRDSSPTLFRAISQRLPATTSRSTSSVATASGELRALRRTASASRRSLARRWNGPRLSSSVCPL
eukprot:6391168-Alexandrium_andersonii.AAC.1